MSCKLDHLPPEKFGFAGRCSELRVFLRATVSQRELLEDCLNNVMDNSMWQCGSSNSSLGKVLKFVLVEGRMRCALHCGEALDGDSKKACLLENCINVVTLM